MVETVIDFLDYYFQSLGYLAARKERRSKFDEDTSQRNLSSAEYAKEFKSYCGRERVVLRRRRTKLRVEQFHIIAQVGQGGYGEVFLARLDGPSETQATVAVKQLRIVQAKGVRRRVATVSVHLVPMSISYLSH